MPGASNYNPSKYKNPMAQAKATGRIVTTYRYKSWSDWQVVHKRSTGEKVYQRKRLGQQTHYYPSGRKKVGTGWATYKQRKTVYPGDYAERVGKQRKKRKSGITPEKAKKFAGKTILESGIPRGKVFRTGKPTGGEKPGIIEAKAKEPSWTPERYTKFYFGLPVEFQKHIPHPAKFTLAQAGITPTSVGKYKEISLPTIKEEGLRVKGITVSGADPEAYKKLVKHYKWMSEKYSELKSDIVLTGAWETYKVTGELPEELKLDIPSQVSELGISAEKAYVKSALKVAEGEWTEEMAESHMQKVMTRTFGELPKEKQVEYGFKFKPFISEPLETWKFYPGGVEYLKSLSLEEREALLLPFMKEKFKPGYISGEPIPGYGERYGDLKFYEVKKLPSGMVITDFKQLPSGAIIVSPDLDIPEKYVKMTKGGQLKIPSEFITTKWKERKPGEIHKEITWEFLIKPKYGAWVFKKQPITERLMISGAEGFAQTIVFPVTMAQTAVKYATGKGKWEHPFHRISTGKTIFFPDVALWLKKRQIAPSGMVSISLGRGISGLRQTFGGIIKKEEWKAEEKEWKFAQKYPLETGFATVGEIMGLITAGKLVGVGVGKFKVGVKGFIRTMPKAWHKIQVLTFKPSVVKGRMFVHRVDSEIKPYQYSKVKTPELAKVSKPPSFYVEFTTRGKFSGFMTKFGQTTFWRKLHHWAISEPIVKLPLKWHRFLDESRTGVTEPYTSGEVTWYSRLSRYRGWGKRDYVPKKVADQFKAGKTWVHKHELAMDTSKIVTGRDISGVGQRLQLYEIRVVGKPKGHLWWKRVQVQVTSMKDIEFFGYKAHFADTPGSIFDTSMGYGSWVRPGADLSAEPWLVHITKPYGKMPNLWKDTTATGQLVSVGRTTMKEGGFQGIGAEVSEVLAVPASEFGISYAPLGLGYRLGYEMAKPKISYEAEIGVNISSPTVKGVVKPIVKVKKDVKPVSISIPEEKPVQWTVGEEKPVLAPKHEVGQIHWQWEEEEPVVLPISHQRQALAPMQEQAQIQMLELEKVSISLPLSKARARVKPEFTTDITPIKIIIPPWLPNGADKFDWDLGGKPFGKKKYKRKKRVLLKTILSDPFSVQKSQVVFGKATHPLPTGKIWSLAEKRGFKLETVEILKAKKMAGYGNLLKKKKHYKKSKKKKKKSKHRRSS